MGRTNEALWERSKAKAKAKMGGKHSARAMQLAGKLYKQAGGKYTGSKTKAQKSMSKWTKEDWGTKSGKNSTQGPKATGERYLPKKARESLTAAEYKKTSDKKRADTKQGKQFSKQPDKIAKKTAVHRANKGGIVMKQPTADQKGLKKLPKAVRNKMGYMNKGGVAMPNLSGFQLCADCPTPAGCKAEGKCLKKQKQTAMKKGGMVKKYYGGGVVKANCGASMKPTQKSSKGK